MKRTYPVINMKKTGQKIKRIMKRKGLTVKEVQKFLALGTPQSIYHWFDGRSLPTLDNLYALSELLHLPVDALLVGNRKCAFVISAEIQARRLRTYHERLQEMAA